ncbi:MAG: hypothetical protein A3H49_11305 [Nitrospirae bacterium RIFCSPLOWO2_02_FULL_62_14]|nr:MAG: hypothetical protein A3H49_11305 [Nitrospirae bacterium RIFCSPLOWO2_02_FULL_62_14]OGW70823.1 MAG: hypothetical protein A3A88_08550 [Nitrospirae bacterium RIFCSPLOWO2_01_FULL_62_17]
MIRSPVQDSPEGAVLSVHVQPKASKTEYAGLHGGALKFRVAASPVEGVANDALCAYLAKQFGIPKSHVMVKAGHASRRKRVRLSGVSVSRVREVLGLAQG